jgi:hypothetical protein
MRTIHAVSSTEPPLLSNFPYILCPLCIPRTMYRRSAWILILIESNMLETERLRKKCITSALDSPPPIIYVAH